jgi:hypothetical protein
LKTFAYGTAEHAFADYFQISAALASNCCKEFSIMMRQINGGDYLCISDENDIKNNTNLHQKVHGVWGMFGSLDCMHSCWKKCPKAWQQSYKFGKEGGGPIVVLEALAAYHLWLCLTDLFLLQL